MKIKKTNGQLFNMMSELEAHLDKKDIIGYACARNYRKISLEIEDFIRKREELFMKYGSKDVDDNGNFLGSYSIDQNSEELKLFKEEIGKYVDLECEVDIMMVKFTDAIGVLSGRELIGLDFMFED